MKTTTPMELLEVMGAIPDAYITEAESASIVPMKKRMKSRVLRWAAVAAAAAVVCTALLQTPMGAAAAEMVKEQVIKLIETLFPPKELSVTLEGEAETILHEASGQEPQADSPGFAMYVDTSSYTMTQEGDSWFVRPIDAQWEREELICEMEIRELPDTLPLAAAEETKAQESAQWQERSWIWCQEDRSRCWFTFSGGNNWDSPREEHTFFANGQGGSFQVISRYFLEAAEGHAVRFKTMASTFAVLDQEPSEDLTAEMEQKVSAAKAESERLMKEISENGSLTQADMNELAGQRYTLWMDTFRELWAALKQSLDQRTWNSLTAEQCRWGAERWQAQNQTIEEMDGGSLTGTVVYGDGAAALEQRVDVLLGYLQDPSSIDRSQSVLSPEDKAQWVLQDLLTEGYLPQYHLSASWEGGESISCPVTYEDLWVCTVSGVDTAAEDMINQGCLEVSVTAWGQENSRLFTLNMTLVWESEQWMVSACSLDN